MKIPVRIAMWSGPRNISTAMLRAWGNRSDTAVIDEPFYAYYLQATGDDHPGKAEVIAHGETDWRKVIAQMTGEVPDARPIFYQKQMTHHLLPEIDRSWLRGLTNCFLIRDPGEVICSYLKKNHTPTVADLGFVQQAEIFDFVRAEINPAPPVIDARDVLQNPRQILQRLCQAIEVPFTEAMLSWPPGLRETDGIWAKHWYTEVERSTSFRAYTPQNVEVPEHLRVVHDECRAIYDRLHRHRLT
ncbi:MAG: HAD family hydrolase [Verrucomicrobiota bacterium]|nr:HAD family hydrolase [Verrucomicrobiota bacterium]